jgi:hypothetical protein
MSSHFKAFSIFSDESKIKTPLNFSGNFLAILFAIFAKVLVGAIPMLTGILASSAISF